MLIKNGKVVLFQGEDVIIEKKDVLIKDGKILKIADNMEVQDEEMIDATDKIVMPGLINTHAHIAMSIFRGTFEGCNLYTWLHEKVWPIEDNLTREQIYDASVLSIIEMISTGTTCFNDQYFMAEETRRAVEKLGMRAVLTRPLMDTDGEEQLKERIKEFKEFYESRDVNNDLITYSVAPHGLYTCGPKCLQESRKLALEYRLPIHTHFLESIDEIEDIKKIHGEDAVQVLKKYFNGIHTILAHGVKLGEKEIKELKNMDVRNCA